jgi:DNA primase
MISSKSSIDRFLNEVNSKVKLSDFVGQYVSLTQKGNSFVGKCPFHNENTPSFNVNNDKALYYCFGCKAGGNILNFTTKYKSLPFLEAVEFLSKYSGIPYNLKRKTIYKNAEENLILKINLESNLFFQSFLIQNKNAYEYIKSRGVSDEILRKFNIGFCPEEKLLIKYLNSKGFEFEQIKKTDLLIKNKNNEYFGRFNNRITFPIYNFFNDLVGFGGRTINQSKIKYINSHENLLFKKSQILFGLHQNSDHIRQSREIILVEGYMDVIKLYCSDIKNAVSSLGTSLSEIQLKKMWNYSDVPLICFDGDKAGDNAAEKIGLKILQFLIPGKSLRFINFPDGNDPDSFMDNKSKEDFLKLKSNSKDLSVLVWETIEKSIESDTPEFLASIDMKIKQIVDKINDVNISKEYFKFLKSKKDNYIWNKNKIKTSSDKKLNTEKIIDKINEKIFILMILIDKKYFNENEEEIFKIKLSDYNLEKEKLKILNNLSDPNYINIESIEKYKDLNPTFYSELDELRKTHLIGLDSNEKNLLFKQVINNLRLPILIDERKTIEKEILAADGKIISDNLLRKYNQISKEISDIKNKDLE